MRIANIAGRLAVVLGDGLAVDVAQASAGLWESDPQAVFARWAEFCAWVGSAAPADSGRFTADQPPTAAHVRHFSPQELLAPAPRPRQVFAIGLNYSEHANETRLAVPPQPSVFTKFPSSIVGPDSEVELPVGDVDWEVEMVVVIGRTAYRVDEQHAWDHVAGLTVGQDLSERRSQFIGDPPQFSLAKSFPGFGPMGPLLVTPDELDDPDDIELGCVLNGEPVQRARTSQMIFSVPALISRLSAMTRLLPGDVLFTGTPAGVGMGRSPQRFLVGGDELVSYVAGIGELRTTFLDGVDRRPG